MFRPWGQVDWVMGRLPKLRWDFVGCIGTEERSLASWRRVRALALLDRTMMLDVRDPPGKYVDECRKRLAVRKAEFRHEGGTASMVRHHSLVERHQAIVDVVDEVLQQGGESVILDITALPKRFFFPILRLLYRRADIVKNLLVTYSVGKRYAVGRLAENQGDWAHLPLFGGAYTRAKTDMMVISVGFELLGLREHVEHGEGGLPIKLLVPFPCESDAFFRSWDAVRQLQKYRAANIFETYRIDPRDVSDVFDRLTSLTSSGARRPIFAPFGPKPISAGICLFATITDSEVFFTQPTVYHPDYSQGVAERSGVPEIYAYCVRIGGRNLYSL
jgi:hypothetical protein